MASIAKVFLLSLLASDTLSDQPLEYEDPQDGKSFFLLGGLIQKIKTRWQNQYPAPYGAGPIFFGYYSCQLYNCRPQQPLQFVQTLQPAVQPAFQPAIQSIPTVVQTPLVVQQSQIYQPTSVAQTVTQPIQQMSYPSQATYGSPQPYQAYPVYASAYATSPGQIYRNAGCTFPRYPCVRKS